MFSLYFKQQRKNELDLVKKMCTTRRILLKFNKDKTNWRPKPYQKQVQNKNMKDYVVPMSQIKWIDSIITMRFV